MTSAAVDDIFGDLPAAKEPERKKKKAKKLKPSQDTFYRTPLKPAHLLKSILKPPTPITTTPEGHRLNTDEEAETSHNADSGPPTENSGTDAESAPIGPSLPKAGTGNHNDDSDEGEDEGETDDDVVAREKALLAEIALIKARMAASKAKAQQSQSQTAAAEAQPSPPPVRSPASGGDSGGGSQQQSRKRRVSFLMDQPKKRVTVDLNAVFSKITKVRLERENGFCGRWSGVCLLILFLGLTLCTRDDSSQGTAVSILTNAVRSLLTIMLSCPRL